VAHGRGGFAFSDALKKVGGNWDFDKMNAWLTSPRKFAPGTKMTFAGLPDAKDRRDVIAFLKVETGYRPAASTPPAS
jgi:cytochrome c